eukprot:scaffold190033_cov32-Tisochrysis_lutea.AAC.2
MAMTDENETKVCREKGAQKRCSAHAPTAFGANTRLMDSTFCERRRPSASSPAACHTPQKGGDTLCKTSPMTRLRSGGLAALHRATLILSGLRSLRCSRSRTPRKERAPLREARMTS